MQRTLEQIIFTQRKQIKLLRNIHRLARCDVEQKLIAEQLIKYGQPTERKIGESILRSIVNGQGFSPGIKPWIDSLAFEALAAGEHTGEWARGVKNAITTLTSKNASTSLLIKSLWKPALGIVGMLAVSAGLSSYLFPMLDGIMNKGRKGLLSELAQSFGDFWVSWGVLIGLISALLAVLIFASLPIFVGPFRQKIDNYPIFRQYRLIQVSAFLRSIGNLTLSGFDLKTALLHSKHHTNPYMVNHISKMVININGGSKNIGDTMNTGLLNKAEQNSLMLLGQIGGTSETLLNSADIHHEILMEEISTIQAIGIDTLKITGFLIGVLMGGGVVMQIMDIATKVVV